VHRQTIDAYDGGAEHWRATRRARCGQHEIVDVAAAFRAAVGHGVILDLGCGPGVALPGFGDPVVGVDASIGMLGLVERGTVLAGDIEALPFATASIAGAFGSFSFQHLPRDGFARALAEVARVLQPGGLVELWMHGNAGVDGIRADDDMGIGRWFTYWSADELRDVVPTTGLELVAIEDSGPGRRTVARRPG
jgi:SAM-dependent methyltransferase